jgi:hypothetical protein
VGQGCDLGSHLPNAQVLQVFSDTDWLYAVTHGRGLWRRQPCL